MVRVARVSSGGDLALRTAVAPYFAIVPGEVSMIKTIIEAGDGSTTWAFGLSQLNLRKLQEGQPILFDLAQMGLPAQRVMIFYGATEEIMETELRKTFEG
jgi:hypothetical protein